MLLSFVEPVIGAAAGLLAGSFLGTMAMRWGRGETIHGRSRCDACNEQLGAFELVPLFSLLALRGRCRRCRAAIDPRHPLMELVCAIIGGLAMVAQPGMAGWGGAVMGWLLTTLALTDFDHFWLPDALVWPLALIGLASGIAGVTPPELLDRVIGAVAGFASLAIIGLVYRWYKGLAGLGAGDPKLLGAIGASLGWRLLPFVMIGAAGLGLLFCLTQLARGRRVALADQLPLGTLMACAAWPLWLVTSWG